MWGTDSRSMFSEKSSWWRRSDKLILSDDRNDDGHLYNDSFGDKISMIAGSSITLLLLGWTALRKTDSRNSVMNHFLPAIFFNTPYQKNSEGCIYLQNMTRKHRSPVTVCVAKIQPFHFENFGGGPLLINQPHLFNKRIASVVTILVFVFYDVELYDFPPFRLILRDFVCFCVFRWPSSIDHTELVKRESILVLTSIVREDIQDQHF
jgi:hypothetical protein